MAIIYSYPTATPVGTDTIIGTQQAVDETGDNLTVTFTMASIANYVTASILPSGTTNYLPLFSSPSTFADSIVSQVLGNYISINGNLTVANNGIFQNFLTVKNDLYVNGEIQGTTASLGATNINGTLDMSTSRIINLGTPLNPQDAATKAYVDAGDLESEFAVTLRQSARFTEAVTIGDPIYITGYNTGLDRFEVARAQAGDPSKMPAVGLADGNYSINGDGNFITHGGIEGLNTNSFDIGDVAYVGALGGLTKVKPTGSNLIQNIGIVSKKSSGNGALEAIAIGRTNDVPNIPRGSIWVGNVNGVATPLPIGSTNQILTSNGTDATWQDNPGQNPSLNTAGNSGTGNVDLDTQSLTVAGGTYITTSASGQTITANHDDTNRSDTTRAIFPPEGGNFEVIDELTTNTQGHVTGIRTTTITLPDDYLDGNGTANTIPLWDDTDTLGDSIMTQEFDSGLNKYKIVVDGLIEADNLPSLPNLTPGKIWVGSTEGAAIESTVVSIDEANDKVTIAGKIDLNDGNNKTIIGTSAGGGGTNITAVGYNALQNNTGNNSNGFGYQALQNNTGGISNGFGYKALQNNTGIYASGFGDLALLNNTGYNSNGFGSAALLSNTGPNSNGFGYLALGVNTGSCSNGFGTQALRYNAGASSNGFGCTALQLNTGASSNGFGDRALRYNTGNQACGFGDSTLYNNKGENNTAIGYHAGYETSAFTGSNNTFLGANASYGTNTTISNSTAVGADITLTDSNTVILGNGASVGIGTTSPKNKLDIAGEAVIGSTYSGTNTAPANGLLVEGNVGIGTTSPNYKLDVDDTIGVGNSLIVNHVPGTFPRVFPPTVPGGFFETEPTGRVGVVNNQDSGEWAFSAVSVEGGANFTNRSGLLHSNVNAYRLVLANTTEENIRLNSDGNSFLKGKVAIGHDTPTEALDVDGIVKVSNRVKTNQISVNGGSEIKLNQATFYNTGNICNKDYTDIGATLHLRTDEPLIGQSVIAITRGGQGTGFPSGITQNASGDYTFLLRDRNNNQRIRFVANDLSSGDSIIDSRRIVLLGNAFGQNGSISIDGRKGSNGVSNAVMKFNKSGTQADTALEFWIGVNLRGSISYSDTGTAYNVASDYRLKENVVEITDGIERLKQLKPSRFNFISNTEKVVDGFIAHEVQEVIPEAVTGLKDATEEYEVTPAEYDDYGNIVSEAVIGTREAYQQIDQAKIVPLLTAALQEAVAKIEALEARIQTLEGN